MESRLLTHVVAKGDSLWSVSVMYGLSHHELASYNQMKLEDTLKVGKVLRIPPGGQYIPPEKRPKFKSKKPPAAPTAPRKTTARPTVAKQPIPADGKYSVKPGDSLWTISRRFGVKIDDIRSTNQLKSDLLNIGQLLILPKPESSGKAAPEKRDTPAPKAGDAPKKATPAAPAATDGKLDADPAATTPPKPALPVKKTTLPGVKTLEHEVGAGETLKSIAAMYEVEVEAVKKANPEVKSDGDLAPNKILIIPYE